MWWRNLQACACLIFLQLAASGCANYEFDLIRPADLATHVGRNDVVVSRSPLEYRLNAVEGRLVMRVYNSTQDPIQLLGDQCSVVDPDGQSHPLPSMAIAPQSFIKLILPPFPPHFERTGPSIGLGLGFIADGDRRRYWRDPSYGSDFDFDLPEYLYVSGDSALFWEWNGETDARISLVFERVGQHFTQDFVFQRKKM